MKISCEIHILINSPIKCKRQLFMLEDLLPYKALKLTQTQFPNAA